MSDRKRVDDSSRGSPNAQAGLRSGDAAAGENPATLPEGLLRYIAATTWPHQLPLVALTVAVFLLEVVPLELQRRVVNDVSKHREYAAINDLYRREGTIAPPPDVVCFSRVKRKIKLRRP